MKTGTPLAFFRTSFPFFKRVGIFVLAGLYLFIYTASNIPSMHHHPAELVQDSIGSHQGSPSSFPGEENGKHSDECPLCMWQTMGQDVPQAATPPLPTEFTYWTQLFVSEPVAFKASAPCGSISARGPPPFSFV